MESLNSLNPFYIMEGILIVYRPHVFRSTMPSLNPFYIMEGILIITCHV